ncbi:MAG: response regulator [Gemmatimonadota bacterium]
MSTASRQRILIVEDDPEIAYLLSAILAADDREVVLAESGVEARQLLDAGDVDLVILDLILPDVDGRSLLTEMRERPQTAGVPIVVVTARIGAESRQDCYQLGADGFFEKPFDPDELAADLAVRLERAARAERMALSDASTGLLNAAGLRARWADCPDGCALGLVEIDSFDPRSDTWGWDGTEKVVREVAGALRAAAPEGVHLARVGGGDFALLMPGADLNEISEVAAAALHVVKGLSLRSVGPEEASLTATIGVMTAEPGTPLDEALDVARRRIFQAREAHGDRVAAADPDAEKRTARVIVAEDDEISATILLHRLHKEGLEVERFDNGQDAYQAALARRPDLVILDVKMPGLDGFEVLERLRRSADFATTPIIMLTSMGKEADVVRGFRLGADDYILKPFSPTELSARVRRLLKRGRSATA